MALPRILRVADSEIGRDLIDRNGHEPNRPFSRYKGLVFGSTIGTVRLHIKFFKFRELENDVVLDWDYLVGMLSGRPIVITIDELKKAIMPLMKQGVQRIFIYTKSMMLGLNSWAYNDPNNDTMRKIWGDDKWLFSPSKIGVDFESGKPEDKPDYTEINKYLKKIKAKYRVKMGEGFASRLVVRQDLW